MTMEEIRVIKAGHYSLPDKIGKLLREGSEIIEVKYDESEKTYLVKARLAPESARREEDERMRRDYERLKFMEKRINVYSDLRMAVRAAMQQDDRLIENYLNRFRLALRESIGNKREIEELETVMLKISELVKPYSSADTSSLNSRRNS